MPRAPRKQQQLSNPAPEPATDPNAAALEPTAEEVASQTAEPAPSQESGGSPLSLVPPPEGSEPGSETPPSEPSPGEATPGDASPPATSPQDEDDADDGPLPPLQDISHLEKLKAQVSKLISLQNELEGLAEEQKAVKKKIKECENDLRSAYYDTSRQSPMLPLGEYRVTVTAIADGAEAERAAKAMEREMIKRGIGQDASPDQPPAFNAQEEGRALREEVESETGEEPTE